jgi:citrate synthase
VAQPSPEEASRQAHIHKQPLPPLHSALEKAARSDDYFVSRKLYPNVDFYSGLVYRALGFPPEFFTVLFAVPRCVGYLAHWRESLADKDAKILRPQQVRGARRAAPWLGASVQLHSSPPSAAPLEPPQCSSTRAP